MNKWIHIATLFLAAMLCLLCSQPTEVEYGTLLVGIRWDAIADSALSNVLAKTETVASQRVTSDSHRMQVHSADSLQFAKIRFTLQPGSLVYDFNNIQDIYTLQAELGIYNLTVEVFSTEGTIIYSTFYNEILIEPNKSKEIQLVLQFHYAMTAPQFIALLPVNISTTGTWSLTWNAVQGTEIYTLQEDTTSTFASSQLVYSGPDTTCTIADKPDGDYYYRVRASSALGKSPWSDIVAFQVTRTLTLSITTDSLANGQVGQAYSQSVNASGGTTPYTWAITAGALPDGLNINASTGTISGTPTAAGTFTFTVAVADAGSPQQTAAREYTVIINPSTLAITTLSLPNGQVGQAYSQTVSASGGTTPYTWAITAGALPDGLTLNAATGIISGMPAVAGTFTFTVAVVDAGVPQQTATREFSVIINPSTLAISTLSLANGQVGQAYSQSVNASGGTTPYTWAITAGALPDGLNINASTGTISGTPTAAGTFTFTVAVADAGSPQQTAAREYTVIINPSTLAITTLSLPNGQVGQAYSQTVSASGGTTPYTWSIASGTLPDGLNINTATGTISGSPTAAGTFTFTVGVADAGSPQQTATREYSVIIGTSTLTITTASLPDITSGAPYSVNLQTSGGTPPYSWTEINRDPLGFAEGVTLDANGRLSGTTYVDPGSGTLQVRVSDSAVPPATSTQTFSWTIQPGELELLTAYLPSGQQGESYWGYIAYRLGTAPLQSPWIISGDLPAGVTLGYEAGNYQLTFSGTPTQSGTFNFSVTIYDSGTPQQTRTDAFSLTIAPTALDITTASLPNGQVGQAYSQSVSASGGTAPYAWSITAGALPDGLNINASTGTISGSPTAAGTFTFTVGVADAGSPQQTATREYTVLINPPTLRITTTSLPDITPNVAYGVYIQASGGTPPYSWTETNREPLGLAEGIVFNAEGYLNGMTGVTPQSGQITLRVTDSSAPPRNTSKTFDLRVIARNLELLTGYLPDGKVGESYWGYITYNYGTPPLQSPWTISGSIPDELYYDYEASNYQLSISGTPINAGIYNFTVTVYDSSTPQKSRTDSFTLTINP